MAIEGPAYGLGSLLGAAAHFGFMVLGIAAGVYLGRALYLWIPLKVVALPISIVIGLWIALVIYRSEPWAAVEMQHAFHDRDDD